MIHEYAVEPQLVARWGSIPDYRYFAEAFGLGRARILGEVPKAAKWRSHVLQAAAGLADLERTRVEMLVILMTERVVARGAAFDDARPWLENAESEHARSPFRAILAVENPRNHNGVVGHGDIVPGPRWSVIGASTPSRNSTGLASALAPMLRLASEVVMVDPHFGMENARYRRPMEHLLTAIRAGRPGRAPTRLEILTSDKATEAFFRSTCEQYFPSRVPVGITMRGIQLREKPGGEKLHQRYVLTDIGGVRVEPGLDEGNGTYDINLMDRAQYELRWRQYAGPNRAFDVVGTPVDVAGTLR